MRVAVVTSLFPGPPRPYEGIFAERRWSRMAGRGHEVRIVHPLPRSSTLPGPWPRRWRELAGYPLREERGGLSVERPRYLHVPRWGRSNARRFARAALAAIDRGAAPEVVVADYAWPAAALAPALRRRGVPFVVHGRGSDVLAVAEMPGLAPELARFLRVAGRWCAVSEDLVAAMDRLVGGPGRGVLVPNGVDLERFFPADRAPARRELGLPEDGPLVLVVGHLIERKDPLLALEAFHRGAPSGARLAFVGRGPLEGDLRRRIRAIDREAEVDLVGEVAPERLASWYAASDCLLLASRREGRPNVVLEALAAGRPVLATEAGGTAELIAVARERMLCPERDAGRLGAMLSALLAAPPGAAELHASVEHLSWERSLATLERVLEEARSEASREAPQESRP